MNSTIVNNKSNLLKDLQPIEETTNSVEASPIIFKIKNSFRKETGSSFDCKFCLI